MGWLTLLHCRPEDKGTVLLVDKITAGLKAKMSKPVGYTSVALDARFTVIRCKESNYANFVFDSSPAQCLLAC